VPALALPFPVDPRLADGRQSATALGVARGAGRLLAALGFACLRELPLASGRRADIVAVDGKGEVWILEIKSSLEDFRSDRKWREYGPFCDRFFFAAPPELEPAIFPACAGLIVADAHGGELVRVPDACALAPARRRAVTLRFAAAAATRLHALWDPGLRAPD
jgi:hypothetical protein